MLSTIPLALAAMLTLGPGKPAAKATPADSNADGSSFVIVENTRNVPVDVSVETPEGERSLGTVPANCVTSIPLNAWITAAREVNFLLDPRGQPLEDTGLVDLKPGMGVKIDLPKRW